MYDGEKEEEKFSEVKLNAYAPLLFPSGPEEEGACVAVGSTEVHVWSFATRLFNAITYAHTYIYLSIHAYRIYVRVCIYTIHVCLVCVCVCTYVRIYHTRQGVFTSVILLVIESFISSHTHTHTHTHTQVSNGGSFDHFSIVSLPTVLAFSTSRSQVLSQI